MGDKILITIGITTHNRAESLALTLESLKRLKPLQGQNDYELVVVDNRSSDSTPEVLMRYQPVFGNRLRSFRENNLGAGWGRNRIVREAKGEIIAYTDDDAEVDGDWIVNIYKDFERWPDASGVGGKTYLIFETPAPAWLGNQEKNYLAEFNLGDSAFQIPKNEIMISLNLALRKNVFEKAGLFRTDLGPTGNAPIGGEETELLRRIHATSGKLYYDPSLVVGHRIPASRVKKSYFLRRLYWHGCSQARRSKFSFLKEFSGAAKDAARLFYHALRSGFQSEPVYAAGKSLAVQTGRVTQIFLNFLKPINKQL